MSDAIIAIDQGTTSSRAMVFTLDWQVVTSAQEEFPQSYPQSGWVEHDPEDIWDSTQRVVKKAFNMAESQGYNVKAIGITNQRETTLIWDKQTGKPIYPAIVWQDRRTANQCDDLKKDTRNNDLIQSKTGLLLDPYFSATKIAWILDHVENARARAENGQLMFGTVDSFLIHRMTAGKKHVTDATNASRTNLFNIHTQQWDDDLMALFNVPASLLPEVLDCADDFGMTASQWLGREIPILGVAGDQHAAAIGQACFHSGSIKSTYGTGCFMIQNTGNKPVFSQNKLLTTVCYRINGQVNYALEGSIFMSGATVQWLRDGLGTISTANETETHARQLADNDGVYLVPGFTGLGAPYWDPEARGAIYGLNRNTGPAHLSRAALESVAYQTLDLIQAMKDDGGEASVLRVDGGMVANEWLMQFMADVLAIPIDRPKITETTALGVAGLAALKLGVFQTVEDLQLSWQLDQRYLPHMTSDKRQALIDGWHKAVSKTLTKPA